MPTSTRYFKEQTKNFITENFGVDTKILDIGAGIGTYSDLLKEHGYNNIDAVEAFEPYVSQYRLSKKYNNVFIGDVTKLPIDFSSYDLIILGDVLEHIEIESAINLIGRISETQSIIAVPFESSQDSHFGNDYEIHQQNDLTAINFFERFPNYFPLCLRFDYGVFVSKQPNEVFLETQEKALPPLYIEFIKNKFPSLSLIDLKDYVSKPKSIPVRQKNDVTIVTGLWNLGRGDISDSFKRSYEDYLKKFELLLKVDTPMYIFVDKSDVDFIWKIRKKENTVVHEMSLDELKNWFEFTSLTNEIRKKPEWLEQSSWLKDSPQATLDSYNPVVMSKMFMLNNVTIWNPFDSEYFFWIDAGITSTVNYGYFTHDKVFDKLPKFINDNKDFVFVTFPYEGGTEIHGFERSEIARLCQTDYVNYVCRGGFFGGKKLTVNKVNGLYYSYLSSTLKRGFMGTEESIFTIIMHNHQDIITQFTIEYDGLLWRFFESLKDGDYTNRVLNQKNNVVNLDLSKVGLYVITFNSPKQFETLIESILQYDKNFLDKTEKFLLDNSSDLSTTQEYVNLCELYNFKHIKKDNLGICGGRQFIAEHFSETNLDYYFFFEDDMFFYPKNETCKNGFNRYFTNLYDVVMEIMHNENFDFLKLNYSEFFGDNGTQWSWYNVPQNVREELWPEKPKLPVTGLDPNAPKTLFKNILSYKGLPYANGEIYYSNWPQVVSRFGNERMFLTTKWTYPYEQTWMSYMYQLSKKGELTSALLLLSPTNHNRFDHYDGNLRKES